MFNKLKKSNIYKSVLFAYLISTIHIYSLSPQSELKKQTIINNRKYHLDFRNIVPAIRIFRAVAFTKEVTEGMNEATKYFNKIILKMPKLTPKHAVNLFELIRLERKDPEYNPEIHNLRVNSMKSELSIHWSTDKNIDLFKLINTKVTNINEKLDIAVKIYTVIVFNQILVNNYLNPKDNEEFAIPGFNFQSSTIKLYKLSIDGHHRLAFFLMNFFLINNDLKPYYFHDYIAHNHEGSTQKHRDKSEKILRKLINLSA